MKKTREEARSQRKCSVARSILTAMSMRDHTRWTPAGAALAFVLIAGVLAMHALAPHDGSMRWMGSGTRIAMVSSAEAEASSGMSYAPVLPTSASGHLMSVESPRAGDRVVVGSAPEHHKAMDLCLAVLSTLVLLALSRSALRPGIVAAREMFAPQHPAAGRPPPGHLRPSLNDLCVARV